MSDAFSIPFSIPSRVVITGTDTSVGKTVVGAHLARAWKLSGWRVRVAKPVESGLAECAPGKSDAEILSLAANDPRRIEDISPYRFQAALAPPVAAVDTGVEIIPEVIWRCIESAGNEGQACLIEGAGGLLAPLAAGLTLRDLAAGLTLRDPAGKAAHAILIVAANRLGCINHTLLTVEAAKAGGCTVCGIVLCNQDPGSDHGRWTNRQQIEQLCDVPVLCELPYIDPGHFWSGLDQRSVTFFGHLIVKDLEYERAR